MEVKVWMAAMTPGASALPVTNFEVTSQEPERTATKIPEEPALELEVARFGLFRGYDFRRPVP
jgi:hypothetical protein